jgi:hypothetical protein
MSKNLLPDLELQYYSDRLYIVILNRGYRDKLRR